jgi:hypothetical protein
MRRRTQTNRRSVKSFENKSLRVLTRFHSELNQISGVGFIRHRPALHVFFAEPRKKLDVNTCKEAVVPYNL